MTRGGQYLLRPFADLPGSFHPNMAHVLLSSLPSRPVVVFSLLRILFIFVASSLKSPRPKDGNYRETEVEIKY